MRDCESDRRFRPLPAIQLRRCAGDPCQPCEIARHCASVPGRLAPRLAQTSDVPPCPIFTYLLTAHNVATASVVLSVVSGPAGPPTRPLAHCPPPPGALLPACPPVARGLFACPVPRLAPVHPFDPLVDPLITVHLRLLISHHFTLYRKSLRFSSSSHHHIITW